ncbi:MAG: hypothetical protein K0R76_46 [Alphaproteobacteria bacterium]|nr:hypothetical protein [Alphaproteobacteria bacterium]
MEKTASVYLSNDGVIRIVTKATTTMGLSVASEPVYFLKDTDNPEAIGLKALEALNGFRERSVPHPKNQEEWKIGDLKWLKSLQITSWRNFLKKGAKSLLLKMKEDTITILPTKVSLKGGGGASFLEHKKIVCSTQPQELGQTILAAFGDCE